MNIKKDSQTLRGEGESTKTKMDPQTWLERMLLNLQRQCQLFLMLLLLWIN